MQYLGGGMAGKSLTVTAQRKLNIYLEHRPDGDKGVKVVAFGTPGMKPRFTINPAVPAPIRGLAGTVTALYVAAGSNFYQLTPSGSITTTLPFTLSANLVSMAYSPTQLVIVDGLGGHLYASGVLSSIGGSFPALARTVTYCSTFFVAEQPGTQNFWVSNSNDGSTWTGLSFGAAAQYSDNIAAVDNMLGNLVVFGTGHMEFWQDVGATPQPFAPLLSATNEWGLAAIFSRAHLNQSIYLLGVTRAGQVQVCQIQGYNVVVVSTPDVDSIINAPSFGSTSDAVGLTYQIDTHAFYQLTFPSADRSFLFDASTSIWSEVQTGHTTNYATRHLANLSTTVAGQAVLSDSESGTVYTMDPQTYTDNGATIERELVTRHALNGYNEFTIDEIFIDMAQGVGLSSGPGSDPWIMLQVSRDSGHTYETEQWAPVGAQGNYGADGNRVIWQRQGSARIFTLKLRYTEPTKFVIANGALSVRAMRPQ